jgi:hypothetical protein
MYNISDAVCMCTHVSVCVYVRVCACAHVCVWGGEGGTCAFITGCPFSHVPENSNLASKGCLYHKVAMLTGTRKGTHCILSFITLLICMIF